MMIFKSFENGFSTPDVFFFNFSARANKKRSNRAQNDYEMVDSIASEKNVSTLPSSTDNKDAIINISEDHNSDEQLPATKVLPELDEKNNLPAFENGEYYLRLWFQFILMKRKDLTHKLFFISTPRGREE